MFNFFTSMEALKLFFLSSYSEFLYCKGETMIYGTHCGTPTANNYNKG